MFQHHTSHHPPKTSLLLEDVPVDTSLLSYTHLLIYAESTLVEQTTPAAVRFLGPKMIKNAPTIPWEGSVCSSQPIFSWIILPINAYVSWHFNSINWRLTRYLMILVKWGTYAQSMVCILMWFSEHCPVGIIMFYILGCLGRCLHVHHSINPRTFTQIWTFCSVPCT